TQNGLFLKNERALISDLVMTETKTPRAKLVALTLNPIIAIEHFRCSRTPSRTQSDFIYN
uniref:hypothetical protein n=1 Tax=Vibrio cholerae TaxID=666 RepID=UPI003075BC0E